MKTHFLPLVGFVLLSGWLGLPMAVTTHSAVLAHYRFEDLSDDSRVYRLVDSGPGKLDGTVEGDGWYVVSSSVAPYSGVGQFALSAFHSTCTARIPLPIAEPPPSAVTIECFFKPAFSADAYHGDQLHERRAVLTRLSSAPDGNGVAWALEYEPCTGRMFILVSYEGRPLSALQVGDLRDQKWHHVAVVYEAAFGSVGLQTYIDGQLATGFSSSDHPRIVWGDGPLIVGAVNSSYGEGKPPVRPSFVGLIDEIRVADQALYPKDFVVDLSYKPLELTITPKIEIAFPTASGNYYQVQWASPLNTNEWNNLGRHLDGNGLTNVVYDTVGFGQNRFYRVNVFD